MANTLKRQTGSASTGGATIFTVPTGATVTIVGLRALNTDNSDNHWVEISINDVNVTPTEMPLPAGGGYEFTDGAKIIALAGDVIKATSDINNTVDLYISYLEQT